MSDLRYLLVKIPSSSIHELNKFTAQNEGEVVKILPAGEKTDYINPAELSYDISKTERCRFLQERENDMHRLLTSISHHWRQPLNVLALSVQDLCELHELNRLQDEDISEFGKVAMNTIQNMSSIIDSFISSYNNVGNEIRKNLIYHIFDLLKLYQPELAFNDIKIKFNFTCCGKTEEYDNFDKYPASVESLTCKTIDIVKFNLVFSNILDNAKEAVYDALKKHLISEGLIEVNVAVSSGLVSICIRNNGESIDEKIKDKIFMPYFTTKDNSHGTGLGLYTAKMVTTNCFNGQLKFKNCPQGVEFTILLEIGQDGALSRVE
ncbi:sensor histidine kinase [Seleniivibrio woodruffii]|uniref:sensor histidine kinase n=1 Tax=Seleniivibrio woodruffii TaxID=1078050 RepID=UPI0026EDCCB6|nr:HAMP domain-containing sensor histidine kinase [Seleniivibrio woodruffii]